MSVVGLDEGFKRTVQYPNVGTDFNGKELPQRQWAEMEATLSVILKSGDKLISKDINGKSDPYGLIGLIDGTEQWVSSNAGKILKPKRTVTCPVTLNPQWTTNNSAIFRVQPDMQAIGVKIIIMDEDTIGKDEFMGEAILLFGDMVEDRRLNLPPPHTTVLTLKESKKMKGKVSGTITIEYNFLSKAKQVELQQRATMTVQPDESVSTSSVRSTLERESSWRKVTPPKVSINLPRLQATAEELMRKSPEIKTRQRLREVLLQLEVWDVTTQYVFWENTTRDGLAQSQVPTDIKRSVQQDSEVIETALDRVWPLFDLNGDGTIDAKELLTTIAMLTEADPRSRAIFFFDVFDTDKSGYLDDVELAEIFRSYWKCAITSALALFEYQAAAAFPSHAAEIHSFIWKFRQQQLQRNDLGTETARHFLQTLDQDGDSRVNREEFVHFVTDEETLKGFQTSFMSQVAVFVSDMIKELTDQIERTF